MPTYRVPGVYIEEQPGPGVITGVGTSTAAFIGPAMKGPIDAARRITSFEEFLDLYATADDKGVVFPYITEPRPFYMAHAVRGFFENGGANAYIVRAGTGRQARLVVKNRGGNPVFEVEAQADGVAGHAISVQTELTAGVRVATWSTNVAPNTIPGTEVMVVDATGFRPGDAVASGNATAKILAIAGNTLTLSAAIAGLVAGDPVGIANIAPTTSTFRMSEITGLVAGGRVLMIGNDPTSGTQVRDDAVIQTIDQAKRTVILAASPPRTNSYNVAVDAAQAPLLVPQRLVAVGIAKVTAVAANGVVTLDGLPFQVGDVVTKDNSVTATIDKIDTAAKIVTMTPAIAGLVQNDTLKLARFSPGDRQVRVEDVTGLIPAGIVRIADATNSEFAIIHSVDSLTKVVALRPVPARLNGFDPGVAAADAPTLTPWEFRLIVTRPSTTGPRSARFDNLSLEPAHPRYIFNNTVLDEIQEFDSKLVRVIKPSQPPIDASFPNRLVALVGPMLLAGGANDQPAALGPADYQTALDVLRDIDDVNLVCIPDAAAHDERKAIQMAAVNHCLALKDRFAILDSRPGAMPSGPDSVEEYRPAVQSEKGFAALYYPWLEVADPTSTAPTMLVPPSGHVAGVYARTDNERGVHKAPANTTIRAVRSLERILSDGQHGPLNVLGINVLRIFPGSGQIVVWGARTTVDRNDSDWRYINVRRLMLFLEESIEEGIRFAVFEPNNLALWQKLKRTINAFLLRVWREGALLGAQPEQAYYVRIDEALNPPSTRALGRLYIEIGVAPVRPAEFIIVRIGLWDGGSEVSEG